MIFSRHPAILSVGLATFVTGLMLSVCSTSALAAGDAPAAPTNLSGSVSGNVVSLTWNVPEDDDLIRGYNIYYNGEYLTSVFANEYTGVIPEGEQHRFQINAFDSEPRLFSPFSETLVLQEQRIAPPSVPTNLDGFVDGRVVTLNWDASTDDEAVLGYNLYWNDVYLNTVFQTSYRTELDVVPGDTFHVRAFDFQRNFSSPSETFSVAERFVEDTPPTQPSGLTGMIKSDSSGDWVHLSWSASTDDGWVVAYNVYRNHEYLMTTRDTRFNTQLAIGGDHLFYVTAFDNAGNFSTASESFFVPGIGNAPPVFTQLSDQMIVAGEPWSRRLLTTDADGGPPGVRSDQSPPGMTNTDNFDGTRSLHWTPSLDDLGNYEVIVTAVDSEDASLETTESFFLSVVESDSSNRSPFSLDILAGDYHLQEGGDSLTLEVSLERSPGFEEPVSLSLSTESSLAAGKFDASFSQPVLSNGVLVSQLEIGLDIGVLPIGAGQRKLVVSGQSRDGFYSIGFIVDVTPVQRDDVYLLVGQSNMVGASEEYARQAGVGQTDEPHQRILQLNVAGNQLELYPDTVAWSDAGVNIQWPMFAIAQDPLHQTVDPVDYSKNGTTVGPGLSFAKAALPYTSQKIILVPAAWSGTSFCDSPGFPAQWNPDDTDHPMMGSTLLFDRAMLRINESLTKSGGILRGIIWLQGESDAVTGCAERYEQNLIAMIEAFRSRIVPDARGMSARGRNSDVPFVVGTMSRGIDERGDYSTYNAAKDQIDLVHRSVMSLVPHTALSIHDDLTPANGYPCGYGDCVHFGAAAYREIGHRYYRALRSIAE